MSLWQFAVLPSTFYHILFKNTRTSDMFILPTVEEALKLKILKNMLSLRTRIRLSSVDGNFMRQL